MTAALTCNCACELPSNDDGIAMPDRKFRSDELPVLEGFSMQPVCRYCSTMTISLQRSDGSMFRFKMKPKEARSLARGLLRMSKIVTKEGSRCTQCGLQSLKSSGRPQADGSPQDGQVT